MSEHRQVMSGLWWVPLWGITAALLLVTPAQAQVPRWEAAEASLAGFEHLPPDARIAALQAAAADDMLAPMVCYGLTREPGEAAAVALRTLLAAPLAVQREACALGVIRSLEASPAWRELAKGQLRSEAAQRWLQWRQLYDEITRILEEGALSWLSVASQEALSACLSPVWRASGGGPGLALVASEEAAAAWWAGDGARLQQIRDDLQRMLASREEIERAVAHCGRARAAAAMEVTTPPDADEPQELSPRLFGVRVEAGYLYDSDGTFLLGQGEAVEEAHRGVARLQLVYAHRPQAEDAAGEDGARQEVVASLQAQVAPKTGAEVFPFSAWLTLRWRDFAALRYQPAAEATDVESGALQRWWEVGLSAGLYAADVGVADGHWLPMTRWGSAGRVAWHERWVLPAGETLTRAQVGYDFAFSAEGVAPGEVWSSWHRLEGGWTWRLREALALGPMAALSARWGAAHGDGLGVVSALALRGAGLDEGDWLLALGYSVVLGLSDDVGGRHEHAPWLRATYRHRQARWQDGWVGEVSASYGANPDGRWAWALVEERVSAGMQWADAFDRPWGGLRWFAARGRGEDTALLYAGMEWGAVLPLTHGLYMRAQGEVAGVRDQRRGESLTLRWWLSGMLGWDASWQ